jgi:prepilin-type N-terminal cleavage/methylation domain-containing protein
MIAKNKKAFTLVELLVVIAIIGLLSTIAVISMTTTRSKGRDATRIADTKQIGTALEQYYSDNSGYPTVVLAGIPLGAAANACLNSSGFTTTGCTSPYMATVPVYPGTASGTCATSYASPSYLSQFCYFSDQVSGTSANYKISFVLENGFNGTAAKNCYWSNSTGISCS